MNNLTEHLNAEGVVERDALLFRAGSYPDKNIEITEEDLDRMVENYTPAPIKVEHIDTPIRFGVVTKIWRVGSELFGRLAFNPLAWALARQCGATKLSAAVRRDKSGLEEVSLVRSPRIADAAVFSKAAECFAGEDLAVAVAPAEEEKTDAEGGDFVRDEVEKQVSGVDSPDTGHTDEGNAEFAQKVVDLEKRLRLKDVDSRIEEFKRQGKLAPAAEAAARSLLMAEDEKVVTFADPEMGAESSTSVARAFEAFLEAQPKVVEFSELVPAAGEGQLTFSDEEERFFRKLGVSPDTVARYGR